MLRDILIKRVIPVFLALMIIGTILYVFLPHNADNAEVEDPNTIANGNGTTQELITTIQSSGAEIISDGMTYDINNVSSSLISTGLTGENPLPIVGDKETLLNLLLERGALYDPASRPYSNSVDEITVFNDADMGIFGETFGASTDAPTGMQTNPADTSAHEMVLIDESMPEETAAYSETNEQVAGINEGDIVKTDGQYIYAMSPYGGILRIIRVDGSSMEIVSLIEYNDMWGIEFYLVGNDRIVIVGQENLPMSILPVPYAADEAEPTRDTDGYYNYGWYDNRAFTVVHVYDISNRASPERVRRVSMDGWNISTRVIGNILYIVTNKDVWSIPYDQADSPYILPYCIDTNAEDEYTPIPYDRMYYIPDTNDTNYMLIGAMDIYSGDPFEPTAYLGAGSSFYMSHNAMYLTKYRYVASADDARITSGEFAVPSWHEETDILRFAINGVNVAYTGTGSVYGSPINQYSMDEYNGYFRIATTEWNSGTYVTVLDTSNMQMVGYVGPFAPGERMQSMRFMGEMGYVVTFENVDPLFTIDLSNPFAPVILGELKIPGFSQYLHPVGDGLLLGIGRDTQEIYTRDAFGVETVIGFRDIGMKVSLFDVNEPYTPIEITALALSEGSAEVSFNPRALMCDRERGIYGFMMENWNNNGRWTYDAVLLQIDEGNLSIAGTITVPDDIYIYGSRLCFIGNTLYLVYESGIIAYNYNSFALLDSIVF